MTQSDHVLLSPLGLSPGAVSALYHALREANIPIERVIVVTTDDELVQRSWRRLQEHLEDQGVVCECQTIGAPELEEEQAVYRFIRRISRLLQIARDEGHKAYVGVTGGRSGMGALVALAAQIYGAEGLYHLWVDREIEKDGEITILEDLSEERQEEVLHPPAGMYKLVELPFFDLSPLQGVIRDFLRHGTVPDPSSPVYLLLVKTNARRLGEIFPAPLTVRQADRLLEIREALQQSTEQPTSQQAQLLGEALDILREAGVTSGEDARKLLQLVEGHVSREALVNTLLRLKDDLGFWRKLGKWIAEHPETTISALTFGLALTKLVLQIVGWI